MGLLDGRRENGNPAMDPTDDQSLNREPWRCMACDLLIHNTKDGYPAPGAPMPKATNEYPKLCSMCATLYWTLSARTYWIDLHRKWSEDRNRRKKNLGDGKDYLS